MITIIYRKAEEGGWTAQVKEFPEAISQGETLEEAKRNVTDALALVREYRLTCI